MAAPREFWIYKGENGFTDEMYLGENGPEKHSTEDEFYDLVSTSDTIEGGIHVIEKSAYDKLQAKADKLVKALESIKYVDPDDGISYASNKIVNLALNKYRAEEEDIND